MPTEVVGRAVRIRYSFLGFACGELTLFVYMLLNALQVRHVLLADHMGEPYQAIPGAIDGFVLLLMFGIFGWLIVGVPIATLVPGRLICRMHLFTAIIVGAGIGPIAVIAISLMLLARQGQQVRLLDFGFLSWYEITSSIVTTVAFLAYVLLLRRAAGHRIDGHSVAVSHP